MNNKTPYAPSVEDPSAVADYLSNSCLRRDITLPERLIGQPLQYHALGCAGALSYNYRQQVALLSEIVANKYTEPMFILDLGDRFYQPSSTNFAQYYACYRDHPELKITSTVPIIWVWGNHDEDITETSALELLKTPFRGINSVIAQVPIANSILNFGATVTYEVTGLSVTEKLSGPTLVTHQILQSMSQQNEASADTELLALSLSPVLALEALPKMTALMRMGSFCFHQSQVSVELIICDSNTFVSDFALLLQGMAAEGIVTRDINETNFEQKILALEQINPRFVFYNQVAGIYRLFQSSQAREIHFASHHPYDFSACKRYNQPDTELYCHSSSEIEVLIQHHLYSPIYTNCFGLCLALIGLSDKIALSLNAHDHAMYYRKGHLNCGGGGDSAFQSCLNPNPEIQFFAEQHGLSAMTILPGKTQVDTYLLSPTKKVNASDPVTIDQLSFQRLRFLNQTGQQHLVDEVLDPEFVKLKACVLEVARHCCEIYAGKRDEVRQAMTEASAGFLGRMWGKASQQTDNYMANRGPRIGLLYSICHRFLQENPKSKLQQCRELTILLRENPSLHEFEQQLNQTLLLEKNFAMTLKDLTRYFSDQTRENLKQKVDAQLQVFGSSFK